MEQYRNVPMSLADASLIAVGESLNLRRVFTLDGDFRIYRTASGEALEVVP
jgi:predicted nucleic acid-binding protein